MNRPDRNPDLKVAEPRRPLRGTIGRGWSAISLLLGLVVAGLAAGCAVPGTPPAPLVLEKKNSDGVYNVEIGRIVEIRLPSHPASGLRWDIDRLDGGVLTIDGPVRFQPDGPAPDGVGTTIFRFRADRIGNGMLRLAHRQPWEQANKGETFTAVIRVR